MVTGAVLFVVLGHGAPTAAVLAGSSVNEAAPIAPSPVPAVAGAGISVAAPLPTVTKAVSTTGIGVLENEGGAAPKGSFDVALVRVSVTCNTAAQDLGQEFGVDLLIRAPHVVGYGEGDFPCRKAQATVDVRVRVGVDQAASKGHWFNPGAAKVFGRVFVGGHGAVAVGPGPCSGTQAGPSGAGAGALSADSSGSAAPSARKLVRVANRPVAILMAPRRMLDTTGVARGRACGAARQ